MQTHRYAFRDNRDLSLDVFTPSAPNGAAILLIHGGALLVGRKEAVHVYAEPLTRRGFTVFTPAYSLLSEHFWPAPLEDIKAAIAWVRDHAGQFNIDPDKIVLEGFSAGGMLSLAAGMEPGVAAVVSFFASSQYRSLGARLSAEETDAHAPIRAIGPGYPPTMILHGLADSTVPYDQAMLLFGRLKEAGAKVDLRLYHDHVHEFAMEPAMVDPLQADVALFLDRAVMAPERHADEGRRSNPFLQPGAQMALPPYRS